MWNPANSFWINVLDSCIFSKSDLETGEGEIIHQLRIKNCDLMLMDA